MVAEDPERGGRLAYKQIGRKLGISHSTVNVHLANIYRRIGVSDRTSTALWACDSLAD